MGETSAQSERFVYSLVVIGSDYIFAGTNAGVFLRKNDGAWDGKNNGMESQTTVYSVASNQSNEVASNQSNELYIYAGTNRGVFRSQVTVDVKWTKINTGLRKDQEIRRILGYADGAQIALLAGSWFDRLYTKEWPGFELAARQYIDLNGTYENILAGSWLVLTHDDRSQAYKVKRVATVLRNDFGQNGKITRIYLETGADLSAFGGEKYRETEVRLESEALELFEEVIREDPPVEGDEIELDRVVQGLEAKRKIIISGKQMRVRIPPMGSVVRQSLLSDKTWATLVNDLRKDGQKDWTYTDVNDLLIHRESHREKIFAGTARGVLTLELGSDIWLDERRIRVLKSYEEGGKRYILAGTAGGVFIYDGTSWSAMNRGLTHTDVRSLEIDEDPQSTTGLWAGTAGGVFIYDERDKGWRGLNEGLKNTDVRALVIYKTNGVQIVWAGTAGGVFRYENKSWESINDENLTSKDVRALKRDIKYDQILAGTAEGVFKYNGTSWCELQIGLKNKDVRAIESYGKDGIRYILAGTAEGVFKHNESSWRELENGLTSKDVRAIESYEAGGARLVWAGTAAGLFEYNVSNDRGWQEVTGLEKADVRAIVSYEAGGARIILAGTDGEVLRLENGSSFILPPFPPSPKLPGNVRALESYADNDNLYILAGTGSGIFRGQLDEINWEEYNKGLSNKDVKALEIYAEKGDRYLLAGTAGGIFRLNLDKAEAEWKNITHDLAKTDVLALATYAESGVRTIFVGTSAGDVFSLKSDSKSWIKFDNSLPNERDVQALATYELRGDRYLFAGTVSGVFRLQLGEHAWEEYNRDLADRNALALDIYYDSGDISLLAGTSAGIFGLDMRDLTASWRPFSDSWLDKDKTVKDLKTYDYNDKRYILMGVRSRVRPCP